MISTPYSVSDLLSFKRIEYTGLLYSVIINKNGHFVLIKLPI